MTETWRHLQRIACITVGAVALACALGPRTARDFQELADAGDFGTLDSIWSEPDTTPERRMMILDGLVASEADGARDRVLSVALGERAAQPLLKSRAADAVVAWNPTVAAPLVRPKLDAEEPIRDDAALVLLDRCCSDDLDVVIRERIDALARTRPRNGTIALTAALESLSRAYRYSDSPESHIWHAVDSLHSVLTHAGPTRKACQWLKAIATSGVPGVREGLAISYTEMRAACATPEAIALLVTSYQGVAQGTEAQRFEAASSALAAQQTASSELARAESDLATSTARLEEIQSAIDQLESALATAKAEDGTYYLNGWIVAALGTGVYEVQPTRHGYQSGNHIILQTVDTEFTTTGSFGMWVYTMGSEEVSMQSGFVQSVRRVEEHAIIIVAKESLAVRTTQRREARPQATAARRDVRSKSRAVAASERSLARAIGRIPGTLAISAEVERGRPQDGG